MEQACFYVRMFTQSGSLPGSAIAAAEEVVRELSDVDASVVIEPYEKLGLYANRVTLSVIVDQSIALALFDAFLGLASTGWAFMPFDEEFTAREAGWDERRTHETFLDPSVRGAFLGVERAS
ncbi:MAG TPA: hypothetical protein VGK79_03555 [Gaiellaceae bacterium]